MRCLDGELCDWTLYSSPARFSSLHLFKSLLYFLLHFRLLNQKCQCQSKVLSHLHNPETSWASKSMRCLDGELCVWTLYSPPPHYSFCLPSQSTPLIPRLFSTRPILLFRRTFCESSRVVSFVNSSKDKDDVSLTFSFTQHNKFLSRLHIPETSLV